MSVLCVFGLTCTPVRKKRKKKKLHGAFEAREFVLEEFTLLNVVF